MNSGKTVHPDCEYPPAAQLYTVAKVPDLPETLYHRFLGYVSESCRQRTVRFLRYEDRCRSVTGEVLCRYAVYRYSGIRKQPWTVIKNDCGKPYLSGSGIHFNISHSGSWVVCGVDREEIGVDVEKSRSVDPGIVERFFSAPEKAWFARCAAPGEQRIVFLKLWTLKESYIKAIGKGLQCPLDSFACLPEATGVRLIRFDQELPPAFFHHFASDTEHHCAVCCLRDAARITTIEVSFDELVSFTDHDAG